LPKIFLQSHCIQAWMQAAIGVLDEGLKTFTSSADRFYFDEAMNVSYLLNRI
jgi:hypothetical protein